MEPDGNTDLCDPDFDGLISNALDCPTEKVIDTAEKGNSSSHISVPRL